MTLAVQTVRVLYNGNGSTTTFAIPFSFEANDEVEVILVSATDVETVQTITTHYTISGTNVVMITAPATGQKLLIRMDVDLDQETDLSDQAPNLPSAIEGELDEIVAQIQMLNERINRCVTLPRSASITTPEIPRTLEDGDVLVWDEDTEAFTATSTDELQGVTVNGTEMQEMLTGTVNGVNTSFTTSRTPISAAGFKLYRSGALMILGTHYTRSGTTVTMAIPPSSPQTIHAVYWYEAS